jgi:hypothetical protein
VSAAAQQLTGLEEALEPFRGACPSCGRRVLAVEVDGREVVVEVAEVLEAFPCPSCAQVAGMGHERLLRCWRCNGGWIGEPLPPRGVALDAMGHARLFEGRRSAGEAVHRLHACAIREALAAGEAQHVVAERFGIERSGVSRIKTGAIWANVA